MNLYIFPRYVYFLCYLFVKFRENLFSEHLRKQLLQSKYLVLFLRLSADDLEAAGFTELSHHLPADSAGIAPDCLALSSDNGDRGKVPLTLRYCFENRSSLRTVRRTVRPVLDIAAGIDLPIAAEQSSPHAEMGIWTVGMLPGCRRLPDQAAVIRFAVRISHLFLLFRLWSVF